MIEVPRGGSGEREEAAAAIDWAAVLARHDRWLRTVVAARLGNPHDVDEVMQEIAVAAVAQRAPLADPGRVAPWLYRLAVLQALLYRRREGRRRKLGDRYLRANDLHRNLDAEQTRTDPLDWLLMAERDQLIRMAMRRLPSRDAEILMLKYSEEWSYREMAEHLGISESAVESRLHRARARLRAELAAMSVIEAKQ
jgi:RNA polymerase sigma-70 factor (ECF subfamily)